MLVIHAMFDTLMSHCLQQMGMSSCRDICNACSPVVVKTVNLHDQKLLRHSGSSCLACQALDRSSEESMFQEVQIHSWLQLVGGDELWMLLDS